MFLLSVLTKWKLHALIHDECMLSESQAAEARINNYKQVRKLLVVQLDNDISQRWKPTTSIRLSRTFIGTWCHSELCHTRDRFGHCVFFAVAECLCIFLWKPNDDISMITQSLDSSLDFESPLFYNRPPEPTRWAPSISSPPSARFSSWVSRRSGEA